MDGPQFVTARGWEDLSAYLQAAVKLDLPVDEGVIGQYLRHPEVARDFAAYWVLYRKYHQDYGVEQILQGKPFDAVLERALQAGFDERISLVSLLLAGLNTRFAAARSADAVTDACYQQLRSYRRALDRSEGDGTPAARFAALCRAYRDRLDKGRALRCEKLFGAHGEPRDDFDERIGWLRDHHLERLEETCGIVRDRPGLAGEEVIRAIKWNVPYPTWEEISFVQRWCIVTEGVVILNHLVGSGAIRREKDESGINRYF